MPLIAALWVACGLPARAPEPAPVVAPEAVVAAEPEPVAAPEPPAPVVLVAGGDVLPHRRVKASAATHGWSDVFAGVAPALQAADLAFVNLESPVAPDHDQGVRGEVFNAPAALLDGLTEAGVDVVSFANNHAFDQGPDGLVETVTRARATGLSLVGAAPDCAGAQAATLHEVRGTRVAFLAATDLLNLDLHAGDHAPCLFVAGPVCTGDCGPDRDAVHFALDEARLVRAVRAARAQADVVVLSFHWGDEYRTTPLPEYPRLAQTLVDAGVDVLLGHHPHVLQPVAELTAADGRRAVVAYSLGNLVSDMSSSWRPGAPIGASRTRDGALLRVTVAAGGVRGVEVLPTYTDNQPDRVRVVLLSDVDPALQAQRQAAIAPIIPVEQWAR